MLPDTAFLVAGLFPFLKVVLRTPVELVVSCS